MIIDNLKFKNSTFISLSAHNVLSGLQLKYFMRASNKNVKNLLLFNCLNVASSIFGKEENFGR